MSGLFLFASILALLMLARIASLRHRVSSESLESMIARRDDAELALQDAERRGSPELLENREQMLALLQMEVERRTRRTRGFDASQSNVTQDDDEPTDIRFG